MPFQFDKSHSAIDFSVRHMMISKVRGRFENFAVDATLDEQNPAASTVTATIDAASISTRDEQRDGHLRSPDFLDAENYPQLTFRSTRVEQSSPTRARLHGDLTIRNVSRPVVVEVEFLGKSQSPWGKTVYGFEGTARLNRKEFGLVWNVALETGGLLVADEIDVTIALELIRVAEAVAA